MRPAGRWAGAALLAALLLLVLAKAWTLSPDLGHGWAACLLIGYLYWERWDEGRAAQVERVAPGALGRPQGFEYLAGIPNASGATRSTSRELAWPWWAAGMAIAVLALPLQLLLVPYPAWPALVWAYSILLVGVALIAAWLAEGRAGVVWLGGPLIVLAGALPWPVTLEQHLLFPLREGMAALAAEACNALGRPALAVGAAVQLGSGWVGVDEACGGIRSLQASVMVALFFGEWRRLSWLRRGVLLAAAAVAAVLGNFLRILFLTLWMSRGSPAPDPVHDAAGWVALALSLALVGAAAWGLQRRDGRAGTPAAEGGTRRPRRVRQTPETFLTRRGRRVPPQRSGFVITSLWNWFGVASLRSWFVVKSPRSWLGFVAGLLALGQIGSWIWFARGDAQRSELPHWTVQFPADAPGYRQIPLANYERQMLLPDAFVSAAWAEERGGGRAVAYYVEWRKGQVARFLPFFHNPTVCLPMTGCDVLRSLGSIPVRWAGGMIPFQAYLFRRSGADFAVAFVIWDPTRGQAMSPPSAAAGWWEWFGRRWRDVREARRDQPAQLLSLALLGSSDARNLGPVLEELIRPATAGGG